MLRSLPLSLLALVSLLVIGGACGNRSALVFVDAGGGGGESDGGGPVPGPAPDVGLPHPPPDPGDCLVAMRLDTCCPVSLPVHEKELASDPCLVPYTPYRWDLSIPAVCAQRMADCPEVKCQALEPLSLLAALAEDGTCTWRDECQTEADCVVAEDCRSTCCSCGSVLPREVALQDQCIVTPPGGHPPPAGCGGYCDFAPCPVPTAACLLVQSGPELTLRRCVAGAGPDAYLLWQAPFGYAGTGPAVELDGSGQLRAWKSSFTMQPHQTLDPDWQVFVGRGQVQQIFAALAEVNFAGLPHPDSGWAECHSHLHVEGLPSQSPLDLDSNFARDLLPEMTEVFALLDALVQPYGILSPSMYCEPMD